MNFEAVTLKINSACFATNNFAIRAPVGRVNYVIRNPGRNGLCRLGANIGNGVGNV